MAIKIIHTADLHLGHNRVATEDTVNDIRKHLLPQLKGDIDILLIVGDIFDGEVSFNSKSAGLIIGLFADIFKHCCASNIIVRIVRGTFSHDRHQLQVLDRLYKKLQIPVNYKLINTLSIEHFDKLGINILFMPDNLPFKTKNEVLDNVRMLLMANNLTTVDYIACHGEFDHINFGFVNQNAYSTEDFSAICDGLILTGHIHKPGRYKNQIYSGSFNRLAHNEEEAKGFWIIEGKVSQFIENTDATKFITVDYRNETLFDVMLERHVELMKRFNPERLGFLRLLISDTNLKQAISGYHCANYPNVKLTFKTNQKRSENSEYLNEKLKQKTSEVLEVPSTKNVASIVCNYLMSQNITMDILLAEVIING